MAKKNKPKWAVVDGVVTRTEPAVNAKITEVPVRQLEQLLARSTKKREQIEERLAQVQEKFDAAVAEETELTGLLAQVNG